MRVKAYFVVTTTKLETLEPEILECMAKGYQLYGPLVVVPDVTARGPDFGVRYFQVVVKEMEPCDELWAMDQPASEAVAE